MKKCQICQRLTEERITVTFDYLGKITRYRVCGSCAVTTAAPKAFCVQHNLPKMAFPDGTHACVICGNEIFRKERPRRSEYETRMMRLASAKDKQKLYEEAEEVARLKGIGVLEAIFLALICKSLRTGNSIAQVASEMRFRRLDPDYIFS